MKSDPEKQRRKIFRWAALAAFTLALMLPLSLLRLPAVPLLAAMLAGICFALRGADLTMPPGLFIFAQGVLGSMISGSFTGPVLSDLLEIWPLALGSVFSALLGAAVLGWLLARRRVLPGTTAIWGVSPGGAAAMAVMSASYGGNMGLVAFMQYLRVLIIVGIASLVCYFMEMGGGSAGGLAALSEFFPAGNWAAFVFSLAFALICSLLGQLSRIPSAAMLLPAFLGAALTSQGLLHLYFPPWFLALSFVIIGWLIGLGFSRTLLLQALHALPFILLSICLLIGLCMGVAALLVFFAGIDPLTAYLATSPGGADSIAIIAASSSADIGFIMSIQVTRLFVVILFGPHLARWISRRMHPGPELES